MVSSSAAAYSHFSVTLDAQQVEKPAPAERTVSPDRCARTSANMTSKVIVKSRQVRARSCRQLCPEERAKMIKA